MIFKCCHTPSEFGEIWGGSLRLYQVTPAQNKQIYQDTPGVVQGHPFFLTSKDLEGPGTQTLTRNWSNHPPQTTIGADPTKTDHARRPLNSIGAHLAFGPAVTLLVQSPFRFVGWSGLSPNGVSGGCFWGDILQNHSKIGTSSPLSLAVWCGSVPLLKNPTRFAIGCAAPEAQPGGTG